MEQSTSSLLGSFVFLELEETFCFLSQELCLKILRYEFIIFMNSKCHLDDDDTSIYIYMSAEELMLLNCGVGENS